MMILPSADEKLLTAFGVYIKKIDYKNPALQTSLDSIDNF